MIYLKEILKTYDGFTLIVDELVFNNPSLNFIEGNNGSGKTTLFKIIAGISKYEGGQVFVNNYDIKKTSKWKKSIAIYLDSEYLLDFLTKDEYLKFHQNSYGRDYYDLLVNNSFLNFFYNSIPSNKLIREFSKGNKAKLGIIATLLSNSDILIFDEPFANLDNESQINLINYLNIIKLEKIILLSTHHKEILSDYCDRKVTLENGKIK